MGSTHCRSNKQRGAKIRTKIISEASRGAILFLKNHALMKFTQSQWKVHCSPCLLNLFHCYTFPNDKLTINSVPLSHFQSETIALDWPVVNEMGNQFHLKTIGVMTSQIDYFNLPPPKKKSILLIMITEKSKAKANFKHKLLVWLEFKLFKSVQNVEKKRKYLCTKLEL